MNETYEQFAVSTYARFHGEIEGALQNVPLGGSVLVAIGEGHKEDKWEKSVNQHIPKEDQEPHAAAAFSHIAALEASIRLVGVASTVLSIELKKDDLDSFKAYVESYNGGQLPLSLLQMPAVQAIQYAIKKGIRMAPTDPAFGAEDPEGRKRLRAYTEAVKGLAGRGQNSKCVVVHVGGAFHLADMADYSPAEIIAAGGDITFVPLRNLMTEAYGRVLMFNTFRLPQQLVEAIPGITDARLRSKWANTVKLETALTNPENSIQIDAPGAIDPSIVPYIGSMVENAANEFDRIKAPAAGVSAPPTFQPLSAP